MKVKTLVSFCVMTVVGWLAPVMVLGQTFTVLHNFTGGAGGAAPFAGAKG